MKLAGPHANEATIRFDAKLVEANPGGKGAAVVALPDNAEAVARDSNVLEGTMGGFPFRAPIEARNNGGSQLRISETLQEAIGAGVGDPVTVEITRVGDAPEVRIPIDLRKAHDASPAAGALWDEITPMARREWVRWIASAKQEETRARRIEVGIDKLEGGMRRPCCFPGLNWVTKDLASQEETWAPLPSGNKGKAAKPFTTRKAPAPGDRAEIDQWISGVAPSLQPVIKRLDEVITASLPGPQHAVKWGEAFYGVPKLGWIVGMVAYTNSVNVFFFGGADFDSPPPLGEADRTRYIKVCSPEDVEASELRAWIEQAAGVPGWR